ncbi:sigma-54-dependent transcriptional regulator [Actomonas aquatica]|uniref:DNA-binding transcriptional regulator NtrC n=1 Tax=Actomonas aquatica TaxID=2866162 RepID=A0ABZ1CAA4_9BACT|nr:sigma-54 dependent transcriptional regulator [Opitutus sp. WL0086]WRQ88310.1 sigma-54 dependent transcriptional regulator [Opitutus sp. WL0086]
MSNPKPSAPTILIIDDDAEIRYSLGRVLSTGNYNIIEAGSGEEGVAMVKKGPLPDLVFLDIRMGGMSGIEALQHIRGANPKQLVVLMTAFGTAQTAIEAMKFGAFDYIMKPFDPTKVLTLAENALQANREMDAVGDYKPTINSEDYKEGIVGSSAPMQEVFKIIGQVTASDVTVMITGESGTGKELVARSIWKHSHRSSKPFIAVNCAAIPDNLIESELFGHEKGSFTGATGQRIGKFELCDGGTIFLDEIGDMALATQTKILRVLQQGEIQRVGGTDTIKVDVRIIAATNKNLEEMVPAKEFREDLYYRLNVVRIKMPPLRERADDIPQIVDFCLQNLVKQRKTRVSKVSPEAIDVLCRYRWHGNVRELENVIYRSAVIAQGDAILPKDLPVEIRSAVGPGTGTTPPIAAASIAPASAAPIKTEAVATADETDDVEESTVSENAAVATPAPIGGALTLEQAFDFIQETLPHDEEPILTRIEREMVKRVLVAVDGNQAKAAERLGMTRTTLRKRIEAYGLKD